MADQFIGQQPALRKERRTRKTHSKVRTGCVTCKHRRKKCDETKPQCLRCLRAGQECGGYPSLSPSPALVPRAPPSFSSCISKISVDVRQLRPLKRLSKEDDPHHPSKTVSHMPLTILHEPTIVTFASETDYHCFDYFRFKTGLHLESYFESMMWRTSVMRTAFSHPIVLKIATAVGAVNRRFNHGISREAFDLCATVDRLYRDAMKEFTLFLRDSTCCQKFNEISMIVSMLFSLFQAFQGHYEETVQHMAFAMKTFWKRPYTITRSESQYLPLRMTPYLIVKLLRQLSARVEHVFGSAINICYYNSGTPIPPAASCFKSQEEARDSIFTELEWVLHLPVRFPQNEKYRRQARNLHMTRIFKWSVAVAGLVQSQGERTEHQKHICRLVKAVRDVTWFMLYAILFVGPGDLDFSASIARSTVPSDMNADIGLGTTSAHWPNTTNPSLIAILTNFSTLINSTPDLSTRFTRLSILQESLTDPNSPWFYTSHDYSADTGIGPPRSSDLLYESSAKTRHTLRGQFQPSILDLTPPGSNACLPPESANLYALAERVSSFEEHAVLAAVDEGADPTGLKPRWVDMRFFHSERKVLLRYCHDDGRDEVGEGGLVWVQQWIQFQ